MVHVLAKNVRREVNNGQLESIRLKRNALVLSSLFFADDALFFGDASVSNCRRLMSCIGQYCQASGQLVNLAKNNVHFSRNVHSEEQHELVDAMQVNLVQNMSNYLGLPTDWGDSKAFLYGLIQLKMVSKAAMWKAKLLSM